MNSRLHICVRLLAGRYHGEEWPPSPARLFQALVAGTNLGCRMLDWPQGRTALAWLEGLEPPAIIAPDVTDGFAYTSYVPNNDSDNNSDSPKKIPGVYKQLSQGIPLASAIRTRGLTKEKRIRPRLLYNQSSTDDDELLAIHYLWSLPASLSVENRAQAEQVCRLARNLVALGWGIDMAIGEGSILPETAPLPAGQQHLPSRSGGSIVLKAPDRGFLDDLERTHDAFRHRTRGDAMDTDTRPRAYRLVPYRLVGQALGRLAVPFDLLDAAGEKHRSFRWEDGMLVAAWLRHAAKKRFLAEGWEKDRVDAYVCAHPAKGEENRRLSYVPLPTIGHRYSDGHHRRALVILPFNDDNVEESLAILYRMAGDPLRALDQDRPVAWLAEGKRNSVVRRYLRKSTEWLSVTPVVLHGRDRSGGKFRSRKADKLILQAFAESGYPVERIEEYSYQPAPFWRGPGGARRARVPRHLAHWPRYHVRVVFRAPVQGPVLVGIGRHFGLGVFAANAGV